MTRPNSPFDHQFRRLMELQKQEEAESSPLFAELLHHGAAISESLTQFIILQRETPELSVLIRLLGKCMDDRSAAVMLSFLESKHPELRRAAANALGWNRVRPALEMLDILEGNDPDPNVREEARVAIDEILRDYPNLAPYLQHHRPSNISGLVDEGLPVLPPAGSEERHRLMGALPRLLAAKYLAVPLRITPTDELHLAVRTGTERRLLAPLEGLTGYRVLLEPWPRDRVELAIERVYEMGDDDFCVFFDLLTPLARREVTDLVLSGVHPEEPACPLDEANDAVEAAQVFLSCCGAFRAKSACIRHTPPMTLEIHGQREDGSAFTLAPPPEEFRPRFLQVLQILAELAAEAEIGQPSKGLIPLPAGEGLCLAHLSVAKTEDGTALQFSFEPAKS